MGGENGWRLAVTQVDSESSLALARRDMVRRQLAARGIRDPRVLDALGRVPRHAFVAKEQQDEAYADHPLAIGFGQTISQPYIVALMTQLANPKPGGRVLDVGTGSGYQAAVLAGLCREVYGIEIVQPLADEAAHRLAELGYGNVTVRGGDGYGGWPEHAPFDAIVVAARATPRAPTVHRPIGAWRPSGDSRRQLSAGTPLGREATGRLAHPPPHDPRALRPHDRRRRIGRGAVNRPAGFRLVITRARIPACARGTLHAPH